MHETRPEFSHLPNNSISKNNLEKDNKNSLRIEVIEFSKAVYNTKTK